VQCFRRDTRGNGSLEDKDVGLHGNVILERILKYQNG